MNLKPTDDKSEKTVSGDKITENVYLCPDGKYRWCYEFRMLKNPAILITVLKVLMLSFGIVVGFMVLGAVSYLILAAMYGWSYQVLFTMDENGVEHRQMKKQFEKAEAIGWLTAAVGLAAGNIGRAGTGLLAATKTSTTSEFQHVRKVRAVQRRDVIYVNQLLEHNQVYVEDADFDFVRNYIEEHCPNAKITG